MKKISLFIFFLAVFLSTNSSQNDSLLFVEKKVALNKFTQLIIRSNITVILIENDSNDSARIYGDKKFIEKVMFLQNGEELIVRTKTIKDLKKRGTIYIPVKGLHTLEINADAEVTSYNTLQSPVLNVLINGNCTFDVVLKGRLNIREAEGYGFTYRRVYQNRNSPFIQDENLNY